MPIMNFFDRVVWPEHEILEKETDYLTIIKTLSMWQARIYLMLGLGFHPTGNIMKRENTIQLSLHLIEYLKESAEMELEEQE